MSGLSIKSDFTDFYDYLHDDNSVITYKRFLADCRQRGSALKFLRGIGVKTIDIKPVSQYIASDGPLVVYNNPKGHNGTGKKIMSVNEAKQIYDNCIASQYVNTENGLTIKFVQIGKRRFTLCFQKNSHPSLELGTLVDIRESTNEYNRLIGLPIFSIDYIAVNNEMVAIDFNEVENLALIGMDKYITAEDVVREIIDSVIVYNKY